MYVWPHFATLTKSSHKYELGESAQKNPKSGGSPPPLFSARGVPSMACPPASITDMSVVVPYCQLPSSVPSAPPVVRSMLIIGPNPAHQPSQVETVGVLSMVVVEMPPYH